MLAGGDKLTDKYAVFKTLLLSPSIFNIGIPQDAGLNPVDHQTFIKSYGAFLYKYRRKFSKNKEMLI